MQLPPVHSFSDTEYFVSGNVIIHETAAIAPGVILEAGLGCQIWIGAGVCIGLGTVITAHAGNVQIEEGVALAPGTLIIGPVTVGHAACIGSRSTIFQQDIEPQALISAGDLLMAGPIQPSLTPGNTQSVPSSAEDAGIEPIPSPWDSGESLASPPPRNVVSPETAPHSSVEEIAKPTSEESFPQKRSQEAEVIPTQPEITKAPGNPEPKAPVVGQVYINQLLLTLFPERNKLSSL